MIVLQAAKDKVESLKVWKEKITSENSPSSDFEKALHETLGYTVQLYSISSEMTGSIMSNFINGKYHFEFFKICRRVSFNNS